MPIKALMSPASVAAEETASGDNPVTGTIISPNITSNDPTNYTIKLSGFLVGAVTAAIQNGSNPLCEVVVEMEAYPGDFVVLALADPEQMPTPGNGNSQPGTVWALRGPGKVGSARTWAGYSVRARRVDLYGGICNVAMNFREGGH